jgi:hypothetical protein
LLRTADVRDVAGNLGVSQATLYRLITTYKAVGTVEALMAGTSGRPTGLRLLDKSVELIIVKCIREIYLTPNRPALKRLTDEVHAKCAAAGYLLPDRLTIRARVLAIPERTRAMRRSDIAGVNATTPLDDRLLFGLLPLGDRVRVAGSAEITGFDPKPVVARCDAIVANAGKTVPSLKAAFRKDQPTYCTGLRPVTPGGTPLIGRTRIKGLWINCGHGHLGWTMACGSGRVLADLMEGRDPGIPLLEPQGYIVR